MFGYFFPTSWCEGVHCFGGQIHLLTTRDVFCVKTISRADFSYFLPLWGVVVYVCVCVCCAMVGAFSLHPPSHVVGGGHATVSVTRAFGCFLQHFYHDFCPAHVCKMPCIFQPCLLLCAFFCCLLFPSLTLLPILSCWKQTRLRWLLAHPLSNTT